MPRKSSAKKMQEWREFYRQSNICVTCLKADARKGSDYCENCAMAQKKYRTEQYARRRALGMCTRCNKDFASEGYTRCAGCRLKERAEAKKLRKRRVARGCCSHCGTQMPDDRLHRKHCSDCVKRSLPKLMAYLQANG